MPGDPLRGIVINKLPFKVPTEPLTAARVEAIEGNGGNSFMEYILPHAALRLKQGFGRLIRTQTDTGIPLIATYSPAYVRNGHWPHAELVISHFAKAWRVADGKQPQGKLGTYKTIKS